MSGASTSPEVRRSRGIRRLAWVTIALAFAPLMGLLLVSLFETVVPPKGHNPFLASAGPWRTLLMVLVITAPAHVPYITILCVTAWGLLRHWKWARTTTLVLAPLVAILSLFAWGGIFSAMYSWQVESIQNSNFKETIIAFSPTAILSGIYCVAAIISLWDRDIEVPSQPQG